MGFHGTRTELGYGILYEPKELGPLDFEERGDLPGQWINREGQGLGSPRILRDAEDLGSWSLLYAHKLGYMVEDLSENELLRIARASGITSGSRSHETDGAEDEGFYVAIRDSIEIKGDWQRGQLKIGGREQRPDWDEKIRAFCELMGLPYRQPEWFVQSIWLDGDYSRPDLVAHDGKPLPPIPDIDLVMQAREARLNLYEELRREEESKRRKEKREHRRKMRDDPVYRKWYENLPKFCFDGLFQRDVQ
jgi:hypothetical protein